jgi:hypothetical protein
MTNPYDGFPAPEPDEWRGPMDWEDIVLEGEWDRSQGKVQEQIGPEFEMWKNNPPVDK